VSVRAVLVVSVLDGSGPGSVMATLAQNLPGSGIEPVLVATHGPTDSALIRETSGSGVRIVNLGMTSMADPRGIRAFASLVKRFRPDVIHTRTIRADLLGRIGRFSGVPVINNVVNLYPQDCLVRLGPVVGRVTMAAAKATSRAVRAFVANSDAVADNVSTAFGVARADVRLVYDGIDLGRYAHTPPADLSSIGISADTRVCLTVARLHPQKGLDDLIDAVASGHFGEDVRFVIAGEGPSRGALEERIRETRLEGSVILLGERRDVASLLSRASLFVLPSRFEGLPTAIIEAMAAGRAVVATAVGGNAEVVADGDTGWLVPAASPASLAAAIRAALDEDLVAAGMRARAAANQRFSAGAMTNSFADLYDVVSTQPRRQIGQPRTR
jgi:glycosyltransferase involved in cell wall biosynthesis